MSIEEFQQLQKRVNKGKAAASEHDLQMMCVNWFYTAYPQYAKLLLAIPNAAKRSKWERRFVLEEGLRAGTPDLFLAIARHKFHGLWIEMKNGTAGRVSDSQTDMIKRLWEQGYDCRIARSMDDFRSIVDDYLK